MARALIVRSLELYQRWVSPALHSIGGVSGACRFQPTCSEYAAVALERHGVLHGSGLALWRLLRCNPFSRGGFDPVPRSSRCAGCMGNSSGKIEEAGSSVGAESGASLEPLRHG
ncbi:MAG TPA: membrane protein insertion efficiency factor YidD [Acidobacteriaceae bacterium]